ncbi:hypothetical protein ACM66B_000852 [Microbotryomycetes sp. NB124-2]
MTELPAILVTSIVSVGDMIGLKLADIGIRMVANVSPNFDGFQLEQALKYLEPRPKVVIVGSGMTDEAADEAKQVWEKRPQDIQDCAFVRPGADLLEKGGLEAVFGYIKEQVKDVKGYEPPVNPAAPSAVMLGANREMGTRLAVALASKVNTSAFLEREGFSDQALTSLLGCMRPTPTVMLVGPAYDDMFSQLETTFEKFHSSKSGDESTREPVFVSVEWAVFFENGGGVDKDSGVNNVIKYLEAALDTKMAQK